jgi:hypothetical protein
MLILRLDGFISVAETRVTLFRSEVFLGQRNLDIGLLLLQAQEKFTPLGSFLFYGAFFFTSYLMCARGIKTKTLLLGIY